MNDINLIFYDDEERIKQEYLMFEKYNDLPGIHELRDLIISFRGTSTFKKFNETAVFITNPKNFDKKLDPLKTTSNPFIKSAMKLLRVPIIPISLPHINKLINFTHLNALLMLLEFNYSYHLEQIPSKEILDYIYNGAIIIKLSTLVENYNIDNILKWEDDFFEKLKNIKFADKKAKKLEDMIRGGLLLTIILEQDCTHVFYNHVKFSALYLMACSAIKNNHKGITCEDVAIGYTLTLNLFKKDLRPEIQKAYNECSYKYELTDEIID